MKIKLTWLLLVCLCGGLLSGCSSPASQPLATNTPAATASPLLGTVTSPVSQATATPTATADPYVALLEKYGWTPEGEQFYIQGGFPTAARRVTLAVERRIGENTYGG